MNRIAKALRTVGLICGVAFAVSGVNTIVTTSAETPSLASYSLANHLATRAARMAEAPAADAVEMATPEGADQVVVAVLSGS